MDTDGVAIIEVEPGTRLYEEAVGVRYRALYEPWGLQRELVADVDGRAYRHVVAVADGRVVGYGRIWLEDGRSKIFQVAVDAERRERGIGAALVRRLEGIARSEGREECVLDARDYAIGFYERLGYAAEGPEFVSGRTGTPHRVMRRRLGT